MYCLTGAEEVIGSFWAILSRTGTQQKPFFCYIKPFYLLPSKNFQKSVEGYPPVVLLLLNNIVS